MEQETHILTLTIRRRLYKLYDNYQFTYLLAQSVKSYIDYVLTLHIEFWKNKDLDLLQFVLLIQKCL
jgi:hypothetical protein